MIYIYKNLIISYINNNLDINIIKEYASSINFNISTSESIIIYNFIKRNYNFLLNGNEDCFCELKKSLRPELYNKIKELYNYYKSKLGL